MFKLKIDRALSLLFEPLLLILAFFTSLTLAPLFKLPYKNPYNISNPFNSTGFNPDNNFYQFVFIIIATLAFFYILRNLYKSKYSWVIKVLSMSTLTANHFLRNLLPVTSAVPIDNFHSGEQLSPANAFLSGTDLFSQMFFLRGAGFDAVIPATGFMIFGHSIGSYILVFHLLIILSLLSFFIFMAFIIHSPLKYTVIITLFYLSGALSLVEIRDIPVWISLGLVLLLFKQGITKIKKLIILFGIGFTSSFYLYASIDRGVLLVLLSLMLSVVLILAPSDYINTYTLKPETWKTNIKSPLFIVYGLGVGLLGPGVLLGWQGFIAFLKMTFIEIPSFAGLLVSQPLPPLFGRTYLFWGPVFISITTGFLLLKLYESKLTTNLNRLLPYTIIFIFSILSLKTGLNRIHPAKLATSTTPLFLITILILGYAMSLLINNKRLHAHLTPSIIICAVTLFIFAQISPQKLLHQPKYTKAEFASYKNMIQSNDDFWVSSETKQVKDYIIQNSRNDEHIFAFTSNPIYYYLTNRKNPTRFYISWYADPQPYTDELLRDLKQNKPRFVIYKEATWMDAPDEISMEDRIPEVNTWIKNNYPKQVKIGNTIILSE